MCELYTLIENENDKECYIQFLVYNDEKLKWVGDNGEPTEVLQQSGWSFQEDEREWAETELGMKKRRHFMSTMNSLENSLKKQNS